MNAWGKPLSPKQRNYLDNLCDRARRHDRKPHQQALMRASALGPRSETVVRVDEALRTAFEELRKIWFAGNGSNR
jgi:hypothetical protein